MFWRKKTSVPAAGTSNGTIPPKAPGNERAESSDAQLEAALEANAELLRILARHAFDLSDEPAATIAAKLERWASHVLVLAPVSDDDSDESARPSKREWSKLLRFVRTHRQREKEYVVGTTTDMRAAIMAFVGCISRASLEQNKTSTDLRSRVKRLRNAVETNCLEELKTNALGVAEAVTRALEEQQRQLEHQARELKDKLAALQGDLDEATREGATDPLTKLQNRRGFDVAIERAIALSTVTRAPLSLVIVDIDHFKSYNDRFGHPVGDRVLCEVSDNLARSFPRRGDVVARLGGDELACLLSETTAANARMLVDRFLASTRKLRIPHGRETLSVTISAGVGELAVGENAEELFARVDRALYHAKKAGRDRYGDANESEMDLERAPAA